MRIAAPDLAWLQRAAGNRAAAELARDAAVDSRRSALPGAEAEERERAAGSAPPPAEPTSLDFDVEWTAFGPERRGTMTWDRWLDHLPRGTVRIGIGRYSTVQPAFRVCAAVAVLAAAAAGWAVAGPAGVPAPTFLAAGASAAAAVVVAHLLHRVVAYGLQLAAFAGFLAFGLGSGADVVRLLDTAAVGVATAVALVRIGCSMAGCCHGRPWGGGLRYGPEQVEHGFPRRLVGVRLFPVQLAESACCVLLAIACAALVIRGAQAGTAFATYLIGYACARFALEGLRGDSGRPSAAGLTQAQWLSLVIALGLLVAGAAGGLPMLPIHFAVAVGLMLVATRRLLRRPPDRRRDGWLSGESSDELSRTLQWLSLSPADDTGTAGMESAPAIVTSFGLRISALAGDRVHGSAASYAFSRCSGSLTAAEARGIADLILRLRHPDALGTLLRRTDGFRVLVVEPAAAPSTAARPQFDMERWR